MDTKKTHQLEIDKMKTDLESVRLQLEEFKSKYLRALADYQNFEKRVIEDKQLLKKAANRDFLLKLLPFLDNLDKAEAFIKDPGLKIAKDHFYKTLKDEGLEEIEVLGKNFDPYLAEVVEMVVGKDDNKVAVVLRKGYKFNGQILRVAQVKVTKKPNY